MDIAPNGSGQRLALPGQSCTIGRGAPIERLCHSFDAPANAQILHPHLTQIQVEMAEHLVEQRLVDGRSVLLFLQSLHHQESVQDQQIEAPFQRIGNGKSGAIEGRQPGLRGQSGIEPGCGWPVPITAQERF